MARHLYQPRIQGQCVSQLLYSDVCLYVRNVEWSAEKTQYGRQLVVKLNQCVTCIHRWYLYTCKRSLWPWIHLLQVCDSYPADLFVPKSATLPVIIGSSKFRSRGRFPTLSYYSKETQVSFQNILCSEYKLLGLLLMMGYRVWPFAPSKTYDLLVTGHLIAVQMEYLLCNTRLWNW